MDHLKMYFLLNMVIFQPAMLVYQRVFFLVCVCAFSFPLQHWLASPKHNLFTWDSLPTVNLLVRRALREPSPLKTPIVGWSSVTEHQFWRVLRVSRLSEISLTQNVWELRCFFSGFVWILWCFILEKPWDSMKNPGIQCWCCHLNGQDSLCPKKNARFDIFWAGANFFLCIIMRIIINNNRIYPRKKYHHHHHRHPKVSDFLQPSPILTPCIPY